MRTRFLIYCAAVILFVVSTGVAQPTFYRKLDGDAAIIRGVTVEDLGKNGFVITGYATQGQGGEDLLLMRTDISGRVKWSRMIGGQEKDNGWSVRKTEDGGFIIAGYTASFGAGGMDILVIRTDETGKTIWNQTYGGKGDEFGWDIQHCRDGGYIIAAQTSSSGAGEIDSYLLKINSKGKKQWAKAYGGPKTDRVFSVRQTPDGGYVAAGITYSFGGEDRDAYLIKTDSKGKLEWQQSYGGDGYDVGHSVALTNDNGFLVTGYGESFSIAGGRDVYLLKTDSEGKKEWLRAFGGPGNDRAMKGFQTSDGGYVAVGFTQKTGTGVTTWDLLLLKTDSEGKQSWMRTFGSPDRNDIGYTVRQTEDGGYIVTGHTETLDRKKSSILLIRTDGMGEVANSLDLTPGK